MTRLNIKDKTVLQTGQESLPNRPAAFHLRGESLLVLPFLDPRYCSSIRPDVKMQASDRFNINSQLEHLQAKYVGTGHADLNRFEWAVNIQRDSYASYVGHYPILAYFAIAENESIGREHYNFMQKMLLPCGLPPEREDD
ncbi:uncharacterized protein At4g14342-like [Carya illinoinensis]|nr:uncharacterized protein At4g14342-like [Carya illinoinensis]